jgi:hypothetical protein
MVLQEEKEVLQGRFAEWLASMDGSAFQYRAAGDFITLVRVKKNENFDYLYCQRHYRDEGINRADDFEYAGVYCLKDKLVYDNQYAIRMLTDENGRGAETLRDALKRDVCQAVDAAINNDRANLSIKELTTEQALNSLAEYKKYSAPGRAREVYLDPVYDKTGYKFTLHCHYDPAKWTEDSLLEYILDPAGYAATEAAAYIDSHQESMLKEFLQADMVATEYTVIVNNRLNPVHRVKRIMAAVNGSSAKTVYVTICKDDIELTFKTEAGQFRRDCHSYYHGSDIVATDRRQFEKQFGRYAHYMPEDILRIEYNRKSIYHAKEVRV